MALCQLLNTWFRRPAAQSSNAYGYCCSTMVNIFCLFMARYAPLSLGSSMTLPRRMGTPGESRHTLTKLNPNLSLYNFGGFETEFESRFYIYMYINIGIL